MATAAWFLCAWPAFGADTSLKFTLPPYNDGIIVSANLDDTEHLCIIDSGYFTNAFDTKLRAKLKKPLGAVTVAAANSEKSQLELFASPAVTLVNFELPQDEPTACFDFTSIREASGLNIEGILGMPLFRLTTIKLDFDRCQLRISPGSLEPTPEWGVPFTVTYSNLHVPTIPITVGDGTNTQCTVDTGSTGSLSLASELFSQLVDAGQIVLTGESTFVQANGLHRSRTGILSKVRVGEFETHNVRVNEVGTESFCGLRYLRRFRATFDLGRNRIYLAKGDMFDAKETQSIGIDVLRKGHRTIIVDVQRTSPFGEAGVLANDELVSIADVPIGDDPIGKIHWMIRERLDSNGSVKLGIRRDGRDSTVSIRRAN